MVTKSLYWHGTSFIKRWWMGDWFNLFIMDMVHLFGKILLIKLLEIGECMISLNGLIKVMLYIISAMRRLRRIVRIKILWHYLSSSLNLMILTTNSLNQKNAGLMKSHIILMKI